MWWLACLLLLTSLFVSDGQDTKSLSEDDVHSMLHDAMTEVLSQQADEMAKPYSLPLFDNFMRSYTPFTGVGNREELLLYDVSPIDVFPEQHFTSFLYQRFNNSDHIVGISNNYVVLHKIDAFSDYIELSAEESVSMHFGYNATVKDAVLFTKVTGSSEVLFIAVLAESHKTSVVNVYEVFRNRAVVVAAIELKTDSDKVPKKIAYVQSSLGSSLVVLVQTVAKMEVNYTQAGSRESNHYIEVGYPDAVDLITFTVQGYGYIAVAGQFYCDVFKLSETVREYIHFSRIGPLSHIVDLDYFRIGFHHILAIASEDGVRLYTWTRGEFSLKQTLEVSDVQQVYPSLVDTCRDEVILVVIKRNGESAIYTFNGQKEIFRKADASLPGRHLIIPGSLTSFTYNSKVVLLFLSTQYEIAAAVIKTSSKALRDPMLVESEKASEIIEYIQDTLEHQVQEINRIRDILKSAVRSTGEQHISGVQHFTSITSTAGVTVQEVNEVLLEWEDSKLTLDEYKQGAEDLEKEVQKLENLVKEIERAIPDVVLQDQRAVITGQKIFTGTVIADTLMATSLSIGKVGDVDLKQLQKDVYRLDKPQKIEGTLTFAQPLTIEGNLDVETTVNGIDISEEVMTKNTAQTSKAQMVFLKQLTVNGSLELAGNVNDIDISEEVVTLHGDHHVAGKKTFLNGIEAGDLHTTLLDRVHVDELYKQAFTKSGNQTVPMDAVLDTVGTNDIILRGRLNGHDVRELERNVVRIDRPAIVTGHKTFTNEVTVEGAFTVGGTINGLRIPDDLVLTDVSNTISGRKSFLGRVTAHSVSVADTIDGIKIPDDVVTLTGDEEISTTLYFTDGIEARRDIEAEGWVDGVDLSELVKQSIKLNETNEFPHTVFSGPVNILGDLTVEGLVNTVNLSQLADDVVYKGESPVHIKAKKHFKKIAASEVMLDVSLNGYNINEDFMKVHGEQNISGTKFFRDKVYLDSIQIDTNMIDGLDVSDIYREIINLYFNESEIDSDVEFVDHVIVQGNLQVSGRINGLKIPDDVVLKNSKQPLSNKHFAELVKVNNMIVDGNMRVDHFGGKDLSQFYKDRLTVSTNQTINGDIYLGSSSIDKLTVSGLVNNINFKDFAANVMSKTKGQMITAPKEFLGEVIVHKPITTEAGVNSLNLSDINRRAFKLEEDNVVTAQLQFEEDVAFTLLNVGEINGINMTRLTEDSLKKTGLQYVQGHTTFNAGLKVDGDIHAGTVNGLNMPEDVLLKNRPQNITGLFTFDSAGVEGDIDISGSVNGLDLSEAVPRLAEMGADTVIESNLTFLKPIHVHRDIEVTGKVNDVNLKRLFDNVLRKTGDQNVTGTKVFRGNVTILGDVDVELVNGQNWREFLEDVVWINKQQVLSPKTFQNVTVKNMFVSSDARVNLINGIDLQKFMEEAVYRDAQTNMTGPIVFKSPVEITGNLNADVINGLRLEKDVITIMCGNGPQVITGQKTFQKMKVFGDIYADSVNSHDLQKLYKDTLLTGGEQVIEGHKSIFGDVAFKKDVHPNTVNGMVLSRDLVTLSTEQEIDGPVTFVGDVFVGKDMVIGGMLNGVDLQALAREAVYLKTDQVIEGVFSFEKAVALSGVEVDGLVNGIDLKTFDKNVTEFLKNTNASLEVMGKLAQDHCELVHFLQESLKKSYYALDSFLFHQELDSPASFVKVHQDGSLSLAYLDDTTKTATTVTHSLNAYDGKYHIVNSSETYLSKTSHHKVGNLQVVINVGLNSMDSAVVIQGSPSNIPSGFIDASVLSKDFTAIALLFPDKGTCDIYVVKDSEGSYTVELEASVIVGKKATSIVLFDISSILYMAVSSSHLPSYLKGSSEVYSRSSGNWQRIQQLPVYGSPFVKHFTYHSYHYLVFGNNAPVYETKEPMSIQVYRNSGSNGWMFRLFQKLPFNGAQGIEFFEFGDISQLHAAVWNETVIQVLSLEGESGMQNLLTLYGKCVKDVKPLWLGEDLYLVVGQQDLRSGEITKSLLFKGIAKGVLYEPYEMTFC